MASIHFGAFAPILRDDGAAAVRHPDTLLASQPPYEVFYIPFEHVNPRARLVIVGITPGMNQLDLAYAEAQRLLRLGMAEAAVLEAVKAVAAFGGEAMRPNLLRMLRHFDFASILGIDDEADLWGVAAGLLHSTSVVPHAAFKKGKMFSGSRRTLSRRWQVCRQTRFTLRWARRPLTGSSTVSNAASLRTVSFLAPSLIRPAVEEAKWEFTSVRGR